MDLEEAYGNLPPGHYTVTAVDFVIDPPSPQ